jgi:hypothetical protein
VLEGRAHIFDYKTKELGKRKCSGTGKAVLIERCYESYKVYDEGGIQTSIYKLMLMELGIQTELLHSMLKTVWDSMLKRASSWMT